MITYGETNDVVSIIRDALTERRRADAMRLATDMFDPAPKTVGELNRWMRTLMGEVPRRDQRWRMVAAQ